ncbi:hypothetical protein M413DRAFT_77860 [Hebeloma cylindrosporum]|uniref:Cytosine-purine permease n=1 Tax=Hebeloma cylindrosporum TaxID=76867 RepID=A0A0C3BYZ1_HEBCY|nr:hypothetical protein M413DRAFT_77860 [Hebeloma cylindrosporum h7]
MAADEEKQLGVFRKLTRTLWKWGIETHGITPTPPQSRTDTRIHQFFWLWFSVNFNILAFSTGSAGPAFFGLDLKSSLLVLLVADLIAVFGPKLGTRAMVQSRFSWGLYGAMIPSALNVFSAQGFLILNCIVGGQALAATSKSLDDTLGIVIIGVISLVVYFRAPLFLDIDSTSPFERFAWIPNALVFPILLGVAKIHLNPATFPPVATPPASMVISFSSFVVSSVVSWCTFTPDYGVYHDHRASTLSIFLSTYFGFLFPSIAWHMLGAALAAAASGVPAWQTGFDGGNNIGGLISAVLEPTGTFGKVLLGIVALSTSCASAPTMYSFGTSFMAISNLFARMPRYIFSVISFAILLPLAIIGAKKFYSTLVDTLSVIGYWSTAFAAIVLTEHFVFRRSSFSAYNIAHWDQAKLLPPGVAAILAFLGAFGIMIPCMSQTWYTGPIARAGSGDIGVYTGGVVAVILYIPLRTLEKKFWPGR